MDQLIPNSTKKNFAAAYAMLDAFLAALVAALSWILRDNSIYRNDPNTSFLPIYSPLSTFITGLITFSFVFLIGFAIFSMSKGKTILKTVHIIFLVVSILAAGYLGWHR